MKLTQTEPSPWGCTCPRWLKDYRSCAECLHKACHASVCAFWRTWEQDDPEGWRRYG